MAQKDNIMKQGPDNFVMTSFCARLVQFCIIADFQNFHALNCYEKMENKDRVST